MLAILYWSLTFPAAAILTWIIGKNYKPCATKKLSISAVWLLAIAAPFLAVLPTVHKLEEACTNAGVFIYTNKKYANLDAETVERMTDSKGNGNFWLGEPFFWAQTYTRTDKASGAVVSKQQSFGINGGANAPWLDLSCYDHPVATWTNDNRNDLKMSRKERSLLSVAGSPERGK